MISNVDCCVIGAGASGLVTAKNLLSAGITFDWFERESDIGGNWNVGTQHSSVHHSTRMISSKRLTEFRDFPMAKELPHYPTHAQALSYLRSYAEHFQLLPHLTLQREVTSLRREGEGWSVHWKAGAPPHYYRHVIIAAGHHWHPRWPTLDGRFDGQLIHARDYRSPEVLKGRRVLIIGGGNSGCDLAVEAARYARQSLISWRRGYHVFPKYLWGAPLDRCGAVLANLRLPERIRYWITAVCLRAAIGSPEKYGLPRPSQRVFQTHPIVNSRLLRCLEQREIRMIGGIASLRDQGVVTTEGEHWDVDLIICATGFKVHLPFIEQSPQQDLEQQLAKDLALHVFDVGRPGMYHIGLIQPNGGIWPLAELQSQLVTLWIQCQTRSDEQNDERATRWFTKQILRECQEVHRRYVDSPRHLFEVDYFSYRDRLQQYIRKFAKLGVTIDGGSNS